MSYKMLATVSLSLLSGLWDRLADWLKSRHGNAVYRRFFEQSNAMLCIATAEGEFVRVNRAFAAMLGYRPEDLDGQKFLHFVHPDDVQPTINAINALRNGAPVFAFRNRYVCGNGEYKNLEWLAIGDKEIFAVARVVGGLM